MLEVVTLQVPMGFSGGKTLSMSWSLCRGPGAPVDLTFRDWLCSMSACDKHSVEKKQDTASTSGTLLDSQRPQQQITRVSTLADRSIGAG